MDFDTNRAAREEADLYYFSKLLYDIGAGDRFAVLAAEDKYSRYDCLLHNITNGKNTPVELKGRDINLDDIQEEGVMIDLSKVKALVDGGRGVIVQFFPKNNKALVWVIRKEELYGLTVLDRYCRRNNVDSDRVLKRMVMLDVAKAKVYDLDMHAYYKIMAFAAVMESDDLA